MPRCAYQHHRFDLGHGSAARRLTFDASEDIYPVFSPDGSRIVFMSLRDGNANLYQKFTNGAKNEEPLLKSAENKIPYSWSADGRFLLYAVQTAKTKGDIWILPMEGSTKEPMLFQATEFNETAARFSPDGHWIGYQSDESGRVEVYVREFLLGSDGKPEATGKHQISSGGGESRNGARMARSCFTCLATAGRSCRRKSAPSRFSNPCQARCSSTAHSRHHRSGRHGRRKALSRRDAG
jgi:Tol biopolymer transport system component